MAAKRNLESVSRDELIAEILRREPPAKAARKPRAAKPPKHKSEPDWTKEHRTCPNCKTSKLVLNPKRPREEIGLKWNRDKTSRVPQSWCRDCRATTHYYGRERKYRTASS